MGAASCFAPSAASAGHGAVTAHSRLAVMQINENLDMGCSARSWQSLHYCSSWEAPRARLMRRRRYQALEHEFLDAFAGLPLRDVEIALAFDVHVGHHIEFPRRDAVAAE